MVYGEGEFVMKSRTSWASWRLKRIICFCFRVRRYFEGIFEFGNQRSLLLIDDARIILAYALIIAHPALCSTIEHCLN